MSAQHIDEAGGRILAQRAGLECVAGIPLARVLEINKARTICRERYEEEGAIDRFGYLRSLADEHGLPLAGVLEVAELLGPEEDFDGLVCHLEDDAELIAEAFG